MSKYRIFFADSEETHNDIACRNVIRKFRIKHVSSIQAFIVSDGLQEWMVDVVYCAKGIISAASRSGDIIKIFTVRGIIEEKPIVSHVVIHYGPESGVKGCSLVDC
jgi:hypothetical protein